ncbi:MULTISPECIES: 23S rRNA (adenine(1618)-N(6))-methyltransferase RlmF [Sphingobacterium]|uniref:23S rRNA (Adenine(1618)-N(6))-methyltransferase RlmF n=1 Tax=Sphingobacterium populi TaxID=1812824 RepID=A0ABW5UFB5_9SPHI|nr:23S rRNA (adenine(1618)-N(6))-methyltransferase RlmF [Sphingobacterium sp. CFCC 11742]
MANTSQTFHYNNRHIDGYDFKKLTVAEPALKDFILLTPRGTESIDFKNPEAVFMLNKALIAAYYHVKDWKLLANSLCPPIPGRVDYLHYLADLIPDDKPMRILDIGTGSSLIYPLLGASLFPWSFVATDTHAPSLDNAYEILEANPELKKRILLRHQPDSAQILKGIIRPNDRFDAIVCNPPFYSSREQHWNKVVSKNEKLHQGKNLPVQNFGGLANELWREGGEKAFVTQLIYDTLEYKDQLRWCTALVADKDHLKPLVAVLEYHKVPQIEIIPMQQGQKISRLLAWRVR